uniref:Uncharacterized protein n=1 Tax=Glossina pallidipes TaxID=7398 RepID=A0A1A9Z383_GLOPL
MPAAIHNLTTKFTDIHIYVFLHVMALELLKYYLRSHTNYIIIVYSIKSKVRLNDYGTIMYFHNNFPIGLALWPCNSGAVFRNKLKHYALGGRCAVMLSSTRLPKQYCQATQLLNTKSEQNKLLTYGKEEIT